MILDENYHPELKNRLSRKNNFKQLTIKLN